MDACLYQNDAMIGSVNVHMHMPMLEMAMIVMLYVFVINMQGVEISHRADLPSECWL